MEIRGNAEGRSKYLPSAQLFKSMSTIRYQPLLGGGVHLALEIAGTVAVGVGVPANGHTSKSAPGVSADGTNSSV
jgi:hypothetical protein